MSGEFAAFRLHYAEMRRRLAQTVIAVLLCSTVAYVCKDTLTAWCMQPIRQVFPEMGQLVYTSLPEALINCGFLVRPLCDLAPRRGHQSGCRGRR